MLISAFVPNYSNQSYITHKNKNLLEWVSCNEKMYILNMKESTQVEIILFKIVNINLNYNYKKFQIPWCSWAMWFHTTDSVYFSI